MFEEAGLGVGEQVAGGTEVFDVPDK